MERSMTYCWHLAQQWASWCRRWSDGQNHNSCGVLRVDRSRGNEINKVCVLGSCAAAFNVTINAEPSPKTLVMVATPVTASTYCCVSTLN
jgi:hypothetical protein